MHMLQCHVHVGYSKPAYILITETDLSGCPDQQAKRSTASDANRIYFSLAGTLATSLPDYQPTVNRKYAPFVCNAITSSTKNSILPAYFGLPVQQTTDVYHGGDHNVPNGLPMDRYQIIIFKSCCKVPNVTLQTKFWNKFAVF